MLTEKQRELIENIWRYDCGHLFDSINDHTGHMDIEGMGGWVDTDNWWLRDSIIGSERTAKGVLGSLVRNKYIEVDDCEEEPSYHFTKKLADEWGMTRYESYCKFQIK